MSKRCIHCTCPLTVLVGERRRVCNRCSTIKAKARQNRSYYAHHAEVLIERSKARYYANRELILMQRKTHYLIHREQILERERQRKAAKKESHEEAAV